LNKQLREIRDITWLLLIVLLPITSMPIVRKIMGSDSVASPSILALSLLCMIWMIPKIINGFNIPTSALPLFLFTGYAIIATCLAFYYPLPAYKNFSEWRAPAIALVTLLIGVLFFLTAGSFPESIGLKEKTFGLLNWSGLVLLCWSLVQALTWYSQNSYPQWMFDFQGLFSSRVLFRQRVTGFALEPSWHAHQLNLLYLPYWFSATIHNYSCSKLRLFCFSFENILLFFGSLILGLTLSRVGYMAFLCLVFLTLHLLHYKFVEKIHNWIQQIKIFSRNNIHITKKILSLLIILTYIIAGVIALFLYSRIDPRMQSLFSFDASQENSFLRYFNQLKFGDRVIYWLSGWKIFNEYPILGIGLGNAGFLIPDHIEPFGWSLVEVRSLIHRESLLLNIKSLWFRLLAETGIIGFSLFCGWLFSLVSGFINKTKSDSKYIRVLGLMGLLTLAAMVFEGLSIDSFAMPYLWVSLGLASSININES